MGASLKQGMQQKFHCSSYFVPAAALGDLKTDTLVFCRMVEQLFDKI